MFYILRVNANIVRVLSLLVIVCISFELLLILTLKEQSI